MPLQPLMLQSPGIRNFLTLVHSLFLDLEILNMFLGTRQSWVSAVFRDDYWAVYAVAPAECRSAIALVLQNTFLASSRSNTDSFVALACCPHKHWVSSVDLS